ncbi:MAG: hypothetical protein KDH96_03280 [Candidatus Riesia sp.]|nr:hypothetical protein [Candidatus Riesia sp.]
MSSTDMENMKVTKNEKFKILLERVRLSESVSAVIRDELYNFSLTGSARRKVRIKSNLEGLLEKYKTGYESIMRLMREMESQ